MPLNLLFALVGGLWFWFAASLAGYNWIQTLKSPIVVGTVLGLLAGDVETGLITGGSIEMDPRGRRLHRRPAGRPGRLCEQPASHHQRGVRPLGR